MKKILSLALLLLPFYIFGQIKVAIIGDDNALGNKLSDPMKVWPMRLQTLLGNGYEIKNFSISQSTYLKNTDSSWWNRPQVEQIKAWKPLIVIFQLGTYDAKTNYNSLYGNFRNNALNFLEEFRYLAPAPYLYVLQPLPVFSNLLGIDSLKLAPPSSGKNIHVNTREVALINNADTINLYQRFKKRRNQFLSDGVHLNENGHQELANQVYSKISGKVYLNRIRIACMGTSITAGHALPLTQQYPYKLQQFLGPSFIVENMGISGSTMLRGINDGSSYWTHSSPKFKQTLAFKPDMAIIEFGTNDSKPKYTSNLSAFETDYQKMIDTLKRVGVPTIIPCIPLPCIGGFTINCATILTPIIPTISKIIAKNLLDSLDFRGPLENIKGSILSDGIHPNNRGTDSLAIFAYRKIKSLNKIVTETSDAKYKEISSFSIFPNPTDGIFFIEGIQKSKILNIEIYNIQGTSVGRFSHSAIDIRYLPSGLYLIVIYTQNEKVISRILLE